MTTIEIPSTPTDWLDSTPVVLRDGTLPSRIVVRHWNVVTPFVVHTAYVQDGEWCYHRGDYMRDLDTAIERMHERASSL